MKIKIEKSKLVPSCWKSDIVKEKLDDWTPNDVRQFKLFSENICKNVGVKNYLLKQQEYICPWCGESLQYGQQDYPVLHHIKYDNKCDDPTYHSFADDKMIEVPSCFDCRERDKCFTNLAIVHISCNKDINEVQKKNNESANSVRVHRSCNDVSLNLFDGYTEIINLFDSIHYKNQPDSYFFDEYSSLLQEGRFDGDKLLSKIQIKEYMNRYPYWKKFYKDGQFPTEDYCSYCLRWFKTKRDNPDLKNGIKIEDSLPQGYMKSQMPELEKIAYLDSHYLDVSLAKCFNLITLAAIRGQNKMCVNKNTYHYFVEEGMRLTADTTSWLKNPPYKYIGLRDEILNKNSWIEDCYYKKE